MESWALQKYVNSMAYKYRWLQQALDDMSQQIGYVLSEFGIEAARHAEAKIHNGIRQLCLFPNSGVRYECMFYNGNQVRILHIRQIAIIYCVEDVLITIIAVWNNYHNQDSLRNIIESR